jgi:N6-adenosine-specific RNA methylase IME4
MTLTEISDIKLPLKDNAVVFLWTTHSFLHDAFHLIEQWNLIYKATMVWDKENMGIGRTIRMQCEFILIAIKGKPILNGSSERDIIREKRREHSRKPEAFYEFVERFTIGKRLDYFSRQKRENWDHYGAETEKF